MRLKTLMDFCPVVAGECKAYWRVRFIRVAFALVLSGYYGIGNGQEAGPETIFGLETLSDIHLVLSRDEWAKLQPPEDIDWDVGKAFDDLGKDAMAGRHFRSEKSTRPGLAGYLGIDHQYGKGDFILGGERVSDVGIRFKGNGTFLEGTERGKLSFKIDFNEYVEGQEFRGLTKLNLQNNITDPSMLREALSYEVFREAGIACSRVGWARVRLTVAGEFQEKDLGLYSVVEQMDKRLLKDRFGNSDGLLLKPSTFGVFRYFGDEWAEYEKAYNPKTTPTDEQKKRLMDFARLVHHSDRAAFEADIGRFLDVDQFLRFLAVNVLLSNLDSFLGGAQNYYVYLEPRSNRFQLLPWDMDHSFGAFPLTGDAEARRDLSIDHPQWAEIPLIERLLAIPTHRERYHQHLKTFLGTIFVEEKLHARITELADFLRPVLGASANASVERFERIVSNTEPEMAEPHPMKYFVSERCRSVEQQLAGLSEGERVTFNGLPDVRFAGLALLSALALNLVAYIWALVAGFRGSLGWGVLNGILYPVAPVIYGFRIRKDLGFRPAVMAVVAVLCLALAILGFLKTVGAI